MKASFARMDYLKLEQLYSSKSMELERALLSGAPWNAVRQKRKQLSELSVAMHHRLQQRNISPAESEIRKTPGR